MKPAPVLLAYTLILLAFPMQTKSFDTNVKKAELDRLSQESAMTLVREYAESQTNHSNGLTEQDFLSLLQRITDYSEKYIRSYDGECNPNITDCSWKNECHGVSEIYKLYASGVLHGNELVDALPVALKTLTSKNCSQKIQTRTRVKPSQAEAWGYGIGMVTIVAFFISNVGIFMKPFMEKAWFKRLLQFLVAMGAGSLAATGLLVLIPESFEIMSVEELGHAYVWKSTLAIFSVYVFFFSERLLKNFLYKRGERINLGSAEKKDLAAYGAYGDGLLSSNTKAIEDDHGHSHLPMTLTQAEQTSRLTLAWMVMAGDVIHNFVDGLAIGAGFTQDLTVGISISLAVFCEELPHELADVAILLHSGMSMGRAILINFGSACVCYIGLILGILLSTSISTFSTWIFAVAGGLFLYIPLSDMLPEMSAELDTLMRRGGSEFKIVAALHLCGLVIGALVIVFIVNISQFIAV